VGSAICYKTKLVFELTILMNKETTSFANAGSPQKRSWLA
jgi:hypothetical protein